MSYTRLANQVELLLAYHSCVVVPEFGGFVLQHFPAHFEGEKLCAPHTCVAFNSQLTHDDGLLVTAYTQMLKLKYPDAKRMLLQDVKMLQTQLQQTPTLLFGRIGTFAMQYERLVFMPATAAFLPNNLGLADLHPRRRQAAKPKNAEVLTFSIRRDTIRRVAACFIGLALLAIAPRVQHDGYTNYANLSPVNFAQIIADRNAAIEAERQAELARIEQEKQRGHFHIIVMTTTSAQADKMCQKLQSAGHDAQVFAYKKNQKRVAIASYQTKKEALREMQKLRQTTRYKRAWVWCE